MLCFHVGATPQYAAPYGQGAGPILLDVLICTGQESRLVDCSHAGIGNTDFCIGGHASDAGIICGEGEDIDFCRTDIIIVLCFKLIFI